MTTTINTQTATAPLFKVRQTKTYGSFICTTVRLTADDEIEIVTLYGESRCGGGTERGTVQQSCNLDSWNGRAIPGFVNDASIVVTCDNRDMAAVRKQHQAYVEQVLAVLNKPLDPTPTRQAEPAEDDLVETPVAEALLAAAAYRVAVSSHSGISNASVLPALQAIPAAVWADLTVAQDWYLETLRRCAGELSDAREGVGYIALCQALCPSNQVGWLRANGYSDGSGGAIKQYVEELAALTPHLQNAVDWLIANGGRFEEQVAA